MLKFGDDGGALEVVDHAIILIEKKLEKWGVKNA
jgi:hypothetical protein